MHVTMARFLMGTVVMIPSVIRNPAIIRPQVPRWVWFRAVSNVAAVFLFFYGIQLTTVSKANLLNMTYPVFVFLFAPFITREKNNPVLVGLLLLALAGVWNVVRPETLETLSDIATGDILAFGSALVAGFAISALRRARQHDSSSTVVFYMMVVGLVANMVILPFLTPPDPQVLGIIVAAGSAGALGQVMLTIGFRHISAAAGALLSTARIPIAGALGILLFADPVSPRALTGAIMIMVALVGVSLYSPVNERIQRHRSTAPSAGSVP